MDLKARLKTVFCKSGITATLLSVRPLNMEILTFYYELME